MQCPKFRLEHNTDKNAHHQPHRPQVLSRALMEYPHQAVSYYPLEDAALVAAFAGGFERHTGPCLPVALTFSKFYTRSVEVAQAAAAPPEEGACMHLLVYAFSLLATAAALQGDGVLHEVDV
eukprot:1161263-Pelagomonas_calceolata.AAC.16